MGVFLREGETFCGLAEMYGYRDEIYKISIGYRLLEAHWGRGIASEAVGLMLGHLLSHTDIKLVTASTMVENSASARVLMKNGFTRYQSGVGEDWGYGQPTVTDKWLLLFSHRTHRQIRPIPDDLTQLYSAGDRT